jgi:hypothetical protein
MAEVDVMQILPKTAYGRDSTISDVPALGEHEIPQFRSSRNDPANRIVPDILAACKVQDAQILKVELRRQVEECAIRDSCAMS